MRYIVIVFDGKVEHPYKSIVAKSSDKACLIGKQLYENRYGKLDKEKSSVEAYSMGV